MAIKLEEIRLRFDKREQISGAYTLRWAARVPDPKHCVMNAYNCFVEFSLPICRI